MIVHAEHGLGSAFAADVSKALTAPRLPREQAMSSPHFIVEVNSEAARRLLQILYDSDLRTVTLVQSLVEGGKWYALFHKAGLGDFEALDAMLRPLAANPQFEAGFHPAQSLKSFLDTVQAMPGPWLVTTDAGGLDILKREGLTWRIL